MGQFVLYLEVTHAARVGVYREALNYIYYHSLCLK